MDDRSNYLKIFNEASGGSIHDILDRLVANFEQEAKDAGEDYYPKLAGLLSGFIKGLSWADTEKLRDFIKTVYKIA